MTPKEKAKLLIDKMFFSIADNKNPRTMKLYFDEAKQCALICVDENISEKENILQWLFDMKSDRKILHGIERDIQYSIEVKQEIEAL